MRKLRLSVVVPTLNCGSKLVNCLSSIQWADEIIVVDMGSTDSTLQIAKKFDTIIYERIPKDGNFDRNRKFGMQKATGDWILKLDSDEVLSPQLAQELIDFLKSDQNKEIDGYYFYNRIYMFGKEIRYGFVKPKSNELRLVRRGKWQYDPYRFHQQITVKGHTGLFKNFYLHFNYNTVQEFILKMNRYTDLDAPILARTNKISIIEIALSPIKTIFKLLFLQRGFLDGALGVVTCELYMMYYLTEKIKIWEHQNRN